MAALTACWLALWEHWALALQDTAGAPAIPVWLMLTAMITGIYVTRRALVTAQDNTHLQRAQRIIAIGGLAIVVAVLWITFGTQFPVGYFYNFTEWGRLLSPEAIAFIVAVSLWRRSIRIGRSDDLLETAQHEFSGGVVALALLFIVNKLHPTLTASQAFWPVMIFFAIGLGSMAVAGVEQDRRLQKDASGSRLGMSRHWLGTVGAIIGLILVGGMAAAGAADPESLAALSSILDIIGVILLTLVGFILYFLAILLLPIVDLIVRALWPFLQRLLDLSARAPQLGLGVPTPEEIIASAQALARTPPFRVVEILICLLVVAFIFMLAVRRFRLLARADDGDEIRESILSRELLWAQLKGLFARRRDANTPPLPYFLSLYGPPDDPRLVIRRAYQDMLAWAQSRQFPRAPKQTPLTYAEFLKSNIPQARAPITILTDTYTRARYGPEVSPAEARRAQDALEQLQAVRSEAQ